MPGSTPNPYSSANKIFDDWADSLSISKESASIVITDRTAELRIAKTSLAERFSTPEDMQRHLKQLKRRLADGLDMAISISIISNSSSILQAESDLCNKLRRLLQDDMFTALLMPNALPVVDISVTRLSHKAGGPAAVREQIKIAAKDVLEPIRLSVGQIFFPNFAERKANALDVLRSVKIGQPSTIEDLMSHLTTNGLGVDELKSVNRHLDLLRKSGLVLYSTTDKMWRITQQGLSQLPASKSSGSSDVARALALARRRW